MTAVHLRPVTKDNFAACVALRVADGQEGFVPTVAQSPAQAYVDPLLTPLAIYDAAALGWERPPVPPVGFTMYEVNGGVGFITRLLVDRQHQGRGYGRAAMTEVVRRLRLCPDVELIATSHKPGNAGASQLYKSLGFTAWDIAWTAENPNEVFLRL